MLKFPLLFWVIISPAYEINFSDTLILTNKIYLIQYYIPLHRWILPVKVDNAYCKSFNKLSTTAKDVFLLTIEEIHLLLVAYSITCIFLKHNFFLGKGKSQFLSFKDHCFLLEDRVLSPCLSISYTLFYKIFFYNSVMFLLQICFILH